MSQWRKPVRMEKNEAHVYIIQHGLKSGAVEVCTCVSVIHIESCVAQPHFFRLLGEEPLLASVLSRRNLSLQDIILEGINYFVLA